MLTPVANTDTTWLRIAHYNLFNETHVYPISKFIKTSRMQKNLKSNYGIHHQVESFFTGNQLIFDELGENFYCANGSVVNKVSVDDGQIKSRISTNNDEDNVIRFALAPSNELIVIAYHSGLIVKFNLLDETIEREFKSIHNAPISYMKINQSNTLLATGSSDGTVKLWNLVNHYCSHNLKGINGVVSCIEFLESPDDVDLLFCASGDDNIHVFDLDSSKRLVKLSTHCSTITDMKLTRNGDKLISVGRDKIAVLWNMDRSERRNFGTIIRTIPIYESVESIVIIDNHVINQLLQTDDDIEEYRTYFATIGEEGQIKFWDSKTGSKILSQNDPVLSQDRNPGTHCFQLCMRPNHHQLCAVSYERDIFIYELPKLDLVQQLQGHIDEILAACWFANDNYIALACNSNDLKVMEIETSKTQHLKGHTDIVLCVKSVPCDSFSLITSSKDCSILIWKFDPDTMASNIVYKAIGHTHAVYSLAVLYDEKIFFSGGEDTTIKKWSFVVSQKENKRIDNSISESLIANQTIKAHDDRIDDIAISPNDQLVATASRDKTAKIFSAEGLQILATLKGHRRGINALNFSLIDQVLVTAGDSTLKMWNLQDFACIKTFQGHDCSVLNFSIISNGLQILSIGSDGNMKLWDCKTNECTKTIDAHSGNTWTLCSTSDESLVVTGGQDEKLIIWKDITKEEQEERIANLQNRVAQEQDFSNYINKKKWRKALKMAIKMENQSKTLSVLREISLEPDGLEELEKILTNIPLDQINFIIDCCVSWNATAKNSSIAQQILYIIVSNIDNKDLMKLASLTSSMDQLKILTSKSFSRYERLVQQATFVDFFMNSFRIQ